MNRFATRRIDGVLQWRCDDCDQFAAAGMFRQSDKLFMCYTCIHHGAPKRPQERIIAVPLDGTPEAIASANEIVTAAIVEPEAGLPAEIKADPAAELSKVDPPAEGMALSLELTDQDIFILYAMLDAHFIYRDDIWLRPYVKSPIRVKAPVSAFNNLKEKLRVAADKLKVSETSSTSFGS